MEMHRNDQPPALACINRESRQIAMEEGHRVELEESTSLASIWVQPRRDVLHFNWTRLRYIAWGCSDVPDSPIAMFLCRAEKLGMQPSVVADIISPFYLLAAIDGGGSPYLDYHSPSLHYHGINNQEVGDIESCAESQSSLDVTMAGISLHITRQAALKSGLFGFLGDAPVQMVDVGDDARLRAFQALVEGHVLENEPTLQRLFEGLKSSQFKRAVFAWERQADWALIAESWNYARRKHLAILGINPGSAWIPYLPEGEYFHISRYLPDERHPWVKHARQRLPKLRPRIMVRYCTNECYQAGKIPANFGRY
ncbi:uncharacterized protein N7511_006250 [Penicillium nucicola]|uniref:uncharacterized protein n=1 Tax=Penicillium nucicola TaxID=1850975 RepID=UPI0025451CC5|nr:uncharacterized protein N7511_006250 [Penicillium nucicola]KAJ5757556.1 hypothetical protein N7511_006250 [Penicillium nucicola]